MPINILSYGAEVLTTKRELRKKLKSILEEIDAQIKQESLEENKESFDCKEINKEIVAKKVQELNKELTASKLPNKEKQKIDKKLKTIEEKELPRFDRYNAALETMGDDRNSYSKTDIDATFMRMKDDHMKNGQLKAAYNIQISTQEQVITNYGIYQNRTDTGTYTDHLEKYKQYYGMYPSIAVADAGYGSEENYEFLSTNEIEPYVKYNWFHKEQKKKFRHDISRVQNLHYNEKEDFFICPMGQKMHRIATKQKTTKTGYKQDIAIYQAQNCRGCPLRGNCHKSKYNRKIYVNHALNRYKETAKKNLLSDQGTDYRKKRSIEPGACLDK